MTILRIITAILLVTFVYSQGIVQAQQTIPHVVSAEELRAEVATRSTSREQNIKEIHNVLSHQLVQKHMGRLVDLERIEKTLPTLGDETLNELASESRKINDQLQAGLSPAVWVVFVIVIVLIIFLTCCPD